VIFVVAAWPKIVDPPAFAHMIYNYKLVPGGLINFLAITMPWIEVVAGMALILGIWKREAAVLIGLMLLVFIAAIGINLAKGHAIDCGCFDVKEAGKTEAQRLTDMRWVIARDVGMLLMVGQILLGTRPARAGYNI